MAEDEEGYAAPVPGYHVRVAERWDESAALARMRRAFEYVELRRDDESHEELSPAEEEAAREIRGAFEARDMRALREATRRYIRAAPQKDPPKDASLRDKGRR